MQTTATVLILLASSCCSCLLAQTDASLLEKLMSGSSPPTLAEMTVPYYIPATGSEKQPLEKANFQARFSGSAVTAMLKGNKAPNRISETRPRFLVKLSASPREERDVFLVLESVRGQRAAVMAVRAGGLTQPMPGKYTAVDYRELGNNHYLLRPANVLQPGEYCLTFGDPKLTYCFGIDEGAQEISDPAVVTAAPRTGATPEDSRLATLKTLLDKKLITKEDFEKKKAELDQPVEQGGVVERLKRLEGLFKKGLISPAEYNKKREELLREL